jgi:hypothetical protein
MRNIFLRGMAQLCLVSTLFLCGYAQNTKIWSSFSGGFTNGSDTHSAIRANTGQPFVGSAGEGNYGFQLGFLTPIVLRSTQTTMSLSILTGWNMMSVPLTVTSYAKTALYPSSTSAAYFYEGTYVTKPTLVNGTGFWVKFGGGQVIGMTGYLRTFDTVNVRQGWNMIGSLSQSITTAQITSIPGGLTTSQFWTYQGSYVASGTIDPGKAYWVKAKQAGQLILASSAAVKPASRISVVPDGEQPPLPPEGDFSDNRAPVPKEFRLGQNYPNPFNPATMIRYDLPVNARVVLSVYNVLGQNVGTLVNGEAEAGSQSASWDASSLPSGIYFYRLEAEEIGGSKRFVENRKMVLIK